jgi:hypothetical protein
VAAVRDRARNDRRHGIADAVFLGNSADRTPVDGTWWDKISGPVRVECERLGFRCLTLERTPSRVYPVPREDRSTFVQPRLDLIGVTAELGRHSTERELLSGYEEAGRLLGSWRADVLFPRRVDVRTRVARTLAYAGYFERLLARTSARIGFVSNFFDLPGMGFVLACQRQGIHSVELLHAAGNDVNPIYAAWHAVPPAGYELLPSVFWTWSASDAAVIERWSSQTGRHRAVVGGNPWARLWRSGTSELAARYDSRIRALAHHLPGELDVLVTLQETLYEKPAILPLLRAVAATQSRWRWWIRQHPTALEHRTRVNGWLQSEGINRAVVDEATRLPLQALLRRADVHVTHSSATVVEAAQAGVPSVITSEYGRELYPLELASGVASFADTAVAIVAGIEAHSVLRPRGTVPATETAPVADLLQGLLSQRCLVASWPRAAGA